MTNAELKRRLAGQSTLLAKQQKALEAYAEQQQADAERIQRLENEVQELNRALSSYELEIREAREDVQTERDYAWKLLEYIDGRC